MNREFFDPPPLLKSAFKQIFEKIFKHRPNEVIPMIHNVFEGQLQVAGRISDSFHISGIFRLSVGGKK